MGPKEYPPYRTREAWLEGPRHTSRSLTNTHLRGGAKAGSYSPDRLVGDDNLLHLLRADPREVLGQLNRANLDIIRMYCKGRSRAG